MTTTTGPEDLLLRDAHVVGDVGEHGRLDEEAARRPGTSAARPPVTSRRALVDADLDVAEDARARPLGDDRAELGVGRVGVADADAARPGPPERADERRRRSSRCTRSRRAGDAGLPGADEPAEGRPARGHARRACRRTRAPATCRRARGSPWRTGRAVATEIDPAHLGAAGEHHLVDQRVLGQRRPRPSGPSPVTTLSTPAGSRLGAMLTQQQRGQRRLLGRLEHHAVPGRQRRRQALRGDHQRVVERRQDADHAEREAAGVRVVRAAHRHHRVAVGQQQRRRCSGTTRAGG